MKEIVFPVILFYLRHLTTCMGFHISFLSASRYQTLKVLHDSLLLLFIIRFV
jgi:hypothetical protein